MSAGAIAAIIVAATGLITAAATAYAMIRHANSTAAHATKDTSKTPLQ